eukprot:1127186-Pleurochrysis_carterae.AAC.1
MNIIVFEAQDDRHWDEWLILQRGSIEFLQHLSTSSLHFEEDSYTPAKMKQWGNFLFHETSKERIAPIIAVVANNYAGNHVGRFFYGVASGMSSVLSGRSSSKE